jgi:potassium efflux system protein
VPSPAKPGAATGDSPEASKPHAVPRAESEPPAEKLTGPDAQALASALREETAKRIEALPKADGKGASAATKALREVYEDRLGILNEWDKAAKQRADAENPESRPEKQAANGKAELERIKAIIDQSAKDLDVLLPPTFRKLPARVPDSVRSELKDAIDAAQAELKDGTAKLEQARADAAAKSGGGLAALRADRDKTHQKVASLKARNREREAAVSEAKTDDARTLAREKLTNGQWEARVEAERLKWQEALLTLQTKRSELDGLNLQVQDARVQLARKTLDRMKARYGTLAAREERDLQQAAAKEHSRAEKADDPLERYRAKRTAELLDLTARVLKSENALTTNPSPSLEEQRALADRAETDFTNVKHLLDDGKVSHLDALRLNNDFRRIGAERGRIIRNELAGAANQLTASENALSGVELELVYDARDDRFEFENLVERLPPDRHAQASALFDELERKHTDLLIRQRNALQKLAERADQTHEQVERRLRILDDHFGFIRTNLFWVRDEEPIGTATLVQAQRELKQVGRGLLRITAEACDTKAWGRISGEFLLAGVGLVVIPWPLGRLRRALSRRAGPLHVPAATQRPLDPIA